MQARLLTLLFITGLLFAQQAKIPLANFSGTVHGVSSKKITIENADGNLLDFDIDHKTKIFRGKKQIHATNLATGNVVTIEARQVMAQFLIAVTITAQLKADNEK